MFEDLREFVVLGSFLASPPSDHQTFIKKQGDTNLKIEVEKVYTWALSQNEYPKQNTSGPGGKHFSRSKKPPSTGTKPKEDNRTSSRNTRKATASRFRC